MSVVWAREADVGDILAFVRELAIYEKLEHEVVANAETLKATLFGERRFAEVVFLEIAGERVGFALFFHNYSTFLGKPGLYLEDLFVKPEHRGRGHGKRLLAFLAKLAVERGCGRFEWSVLDWNKPAIEVYLGLGATPQSEWTVHRLTGDALAALAAKSRD